MSNQTVDAILEQAGMDKPVADYFARNPQLLEEAVLKAKIALYTERLETIEAAQKLPHANKAQKAKTSKLLRQYRGKVPVDQIPFVVQTLIEARKQPTQLAIAKELGISAPMLNTLRKRYPEIKEMMDDAICNAKRLVLKKEAA